MNSKKKKILQSILNFNIIIGTILVLSSVIILVYLLLPELIYSIFPQTINNELISIQYPVTIEDQLQQRLSDSDDETDQIPNMPPKDSTLPSVPTLIIDNIGVKAQVHRDQDSNTALNKGPWMVPDHGDPINNSLPMIIASHRFGAIEWTKTERDLR